MATQVKGRKVVIKSSGQVVRILEGDDLDKLEREANVIAQELRASGAVDVSVKTVSMISG